MPAVELQARPQSRLLAARPAHAPSPRPCKPPRSLPETVRAETVRAANESPTTTSSSSSSRSQQCTVHFTAEGITVAAGAGEELMEVATRAGVTIPTGCWSGNCGVCEVELRKYEQQQQQQGQGTQQQQQQQQQERPPAAVVRACIAKLPPGYAHIEIDMLDDAIWGLDGFDT